MGMYLLSIWRYCKCDNSKISMSNCPSSEIGNSNVSYGTVFHLIIKYTREKSLISPGIIEDIVQTALHRHRIKRITFITI